MFPREPKGRRDAEVPAPGCQAGGETTPPRPFSGEVSLFAVFGPSAEWIGPISWREPSASPRPRTQTQISSTVATAPPKPHWNPV